MPNMNKLFVLCASLVGLMASSAAIAGQGDVVAVMKIKGALAEQPSGMGLGPLLGEESPPNMFELLKKLRHARSDEKLKAFIFDIDEALLGFGQIQELRSQIEGLRAADKDVWVFSESLNNGTMLLASSASRLVLVPTGEVALSGLYGEALYFKNLLDNIHMEADIVHIGDYKSAGEPFYRTGPSDEDKKQTNRLFDSLYGSLVEGIAKSRRLTPERVKELVNEGVLSAEDALKAKLVDKLMYREDFVETIKKRYGSGTEVVFDYGGEKGPEIDFNNPFGMFKFFGELMKGPKESDETAVAVVYVEGPITTGKTEEGLFGGAANAGSDTVRKAIAEAAADDSVKALVLRVDSPGGSALASDVICEGAKRFKDTGRPFIVSMGNVAASGGYYVSAQADTIFAEPGTITGSIGVVGGKFVTKGFWDWAGVTGHEYKRGKHADLMNSNRKFTDEERKVVMDFMHRVYGDFKGRVEEGRGKKLKGDLDSLAGGRVYTGIEALENGLVDQLGGLADAIKHAASEAEIADYEIRVFPKPKTFLDMLAEALTGGGSDEEFVRLGATLGRLSNGRFASIPSVSAAVDALYKLDPGKAKILQDFLIHMELLANEKVLMIGPSLTTRFR